MKTIRLKSANGSYDLPWGDGQEDLEELRGQAIDACGLEQGTSVELVHEDGHIVTNTRNIQDGEIIHVTVMTQGV